jgi:hypothetical protein
MNNRELKGHTMPPHALELYREHRNGDPNIHDAPGGEVIVSVILSKKKNVYVHVSYSEVFPR